MEWVNSASNGFSLKAVTVCRVRLARRRLQALHECFELGQHGLRIVNVALDNFHDRRTGNRPGRTGFKCGGHLLRRGDAKALQRRSGVIFGQFSTGGARQRGAVFRSGNASA